VRGAEHTLYRAKGASCMGTVVCPNCQARYRVADAETARRATCKKCGREFPIAAASADPTDFLIELEPPAGGLKPNGAPLVPDAAADPERPWCETSTARLSGESRRRFRMCTFSQALRRPVNPGVASCVLFLCAFSLNVICLGMGCQQNDKLQAKGIRYPGPPDAMIHGVGGGLILHLAGLVMGGIGLAGSADRRGIASTGCALNALGLSCVCGSFFLQFFCYSRYP
jgi:predicted Zn finger-like uncharacterized protein